MRWSRSFGLLVVACLLLGCARATRAADLTDDECVKFAQRFESLINARKPAELSSLVDWGAIVETSCAGLPANADDKAQLKKAWGGGGVFEKPVCETVAAGGSYHFLRIKADAGGKRALFRLLLPRKAANYHELVLTRNPQGEVQASDIYIYLTGGMISETLHWGLVQALAGNNQKLVGRLPGAESAFTQALPKIAKANQAIAAKEFQKALDLYHELPEEVQHSNLGMIVRLQAAPEISEVEANSAFADFQKYQPNNSAMDLYAIDYHFARKEYAETRKSLGTLYKRLGGDAYLLVLAASASMEEGNLEKAATTIQRAIEEEPTLGDTYLAKIAIGLKQRDFAAVRNAIEQLEANTTLTMSPEKIATDPEYAEFSKSPEFKAWRTKKQAAQ